MINNYLHRIIYIDMAVGYRNHGTYIFMRNFELNSTRKRLFGRHWQAAGRIILTFER